MNHQALNSADGISGEAPRALKPLELWLAPGILAGIALVQIAWTHLGSLSPWKGGGFGMFSSVDGPGMRVLQAEGIDEEGQVVRLDVLGSLGGKLSDNLMARPNLSELGPMAGGLLTQEWVALDAEDQYLNQVIREKDAKGNQSSVKPPGLPDSTSPPALKSDSDDEPPMYRVRTPNDLPGIPTKRLRGIRLQWWRLRWDNQKAQLYSEPLGREVRSGEHLWRDEQAPGAEP